MPMSLLPRVPADRCGQVRRDADTYADTYPVDSTRRREAKGGESPDYIGHFGCRSRRLRTDRPLDRLFSYLSSTFTLTAKVERHKENSFLTTERTKIHGEEPEQPGQTTDFHRFSRINSFISAQSCKHESFDKPFDRLIAGSGSSLYTKDTKSSFSYDYEYHAAWNWSTNNLLIMRAKAVKPWQPQINADTRR
jgi:hypothetical protein